MPNISLWLLAPVPQTSGNFTFETIHAGLRDATPAARQMELLHMEASRLGYTHEHGKKVMGGRQRGGLDMGAWRCSGPGLPCQNHDCQSWFSEPLKT